MRPLQFIFFATLLGCRHDLLFYYGEEPVTMQDLSYADQKKIYDEEQKAYQKKLEVIADFVIQKRLNDIAKKEDISFSEAKDRHFPEMAVSDQDLVQLYQKWGKGLDFELIRPELENMLRQQNKQQQRKAFLQSIETDIGFYPEFPEPVRPKQKSQPKTQLASWGPEGAPLTISQFGDFTCPHCQEIAPQWLQLIQEFPDLRFEFHVVSLRDREESRKMAIKAICAQKIGNFGAFYQAFAQRSLQQEEKWIGNKKDFDKCIQSSEVATEFSVRQQIVKELQIHKTPTIMINGQLTETDTNLTRLREEIAHAH